MIPVSVIIMTKNEEKNIGKCLDSVHRFGQIFVVDSNSEDRTREIAAEKGASVVPFTWNGKYPKKKQWCLVNLPFRYDWVLYVDADEEVYPELAEEINGIMQNGPGHDGYFVKFDYVFLRKVLRHGHHVYKLVLFHRKKGSFLDYDDLDAANMWEVEGHYQPHIDGVTAVLRNRMLHDDHDSLFHYFARHNRYSDWEAVLRQKGKIVNRGESQPGLRMTMKLMFDRMPLKGLVSFLHSYVFKLGFLDGPAGFHFALARAFYYWQIGVKSREVAQKEKTDTLPRHS